MASTFSTNLAIELIGTGDQAGTWGVTTNTNLGTLIEQAISGYVTQAVSTGADTTITIPNGATGVARNMYIELTGTGGTNTNLIVPSNKKLYIIFNNTASGQVTVKVSGQTGVSVPNGKKMILVSNGTDIVNGLNYIADFGTNSFTVTNLTASSGTITNLIATTGTITTLSATSGSITNLVSSDASATVLRSASATLTHLSATSASITNLALTSLTISSLSITNVSVASATVSSNLTLSGGTANGVAYLNGSKVLTTGSALTFDGARLGIGSTANTEGLLTVGTGTVTDKNGIVLYRGAASSVSSTQAALFNELNGIGSGESLTFRSPAGYKFQNNDGSSEWMRLTSTGLGIGTSSPAEKLDVNGAIAIGGTKFFSKITSDSYIWNNTSALNFVSSDGNTVQMKLDSSGNLGLGVTPSAWQSIRRALQVGTNGALWGQASGAGTLFLSNNTYFDGTNFRYLNTSGASYLAQQTDGSFTFNSAASGTAGNAISFTQAMTLDASGRLGVGVTSPAAKVDVNGRVRLTPNVSDLNYLAELYANYDSAHPFQIDVKNNGATYEAIGVYANGGGGNERLTVPSMPFVVGGTATYGKLTAYANSNGVNDVWIRNDSAGSSSQCGVVLNASGNSWRMGMGSTANNNNALTWVLDVSGSPSEKMRLDTSGNLGVGTTSPGARLEVRYDLTASTNLAPTSVKLYNNSDGGAGIEFSNSVGGKSKISFGVESTGSGTDDSYIGFSTSQNAAALSERARIDQYGNFGLNQNGTAVNKGIFMLLEGYTSASRIGICHENGVTGGNKFMEYYYNSNLIGSVEQSGTTAVLYNTTSDRRLKDNIAPAPSVSDIIDSIQIVSYNWKSAPDEYVTYGVVAQDLHAVAPQAVSVGDDGDTVEKPWAVDYSKLVPMLVKEIQSLRARVAQLESK